jgi:fido (protein-threonine AMPylation protein)
MATPSDKLASSLEVLQALQELGVAAIRSSQLTRTHRERLVKNGFLQEVMKGWYIPSRQDEAAGESTAWYASFWDFSAAYLEERFGDKWSLSPEQSLAIHAENWTVPEQLLVRTERGDNKPVVLPHGTSLFIFRSTLPAMEQSTVNHGLRLYSLPAALIASGPTAFRQHPTDMRVVLAMIQDASEVLGLLLEGGHSVVAGRLAGAFRNIGNNKIADQIIKTMRTADFKVQEEDPFEAAAIYQPPPRERSPYVNRLRLMWQEMREHITGNFPEPPGLPADQEHYLKHIDDVYVTDAYHSLSIEGYRVSPELIERVRSGDWNPDNDEDDRQRRDALAARGYWQAHQRVRETVTRIIAGEDPGAATDADHSDWYQELFGPSVTAGLLRTADLAGYRNDQVYIRNSLHTPPRVQAVRECMPVLFDLLREEVDPATRVILGQFVFVYIHPYMDGNGRMGRFLMNAMLAGGGYPWTVIPVERRDDYMQALEQASVHQNIEPFTAFLAGLVEEALAE